MNGNLPIFGATYRRVQCLHQRMVYMKRKLWGRRAKKCKARVGAKSAPTGTEFAQIRRYLLLGTVLAPTNGAYEKEAMREESLQMHSLGWCKKRTKLDGLQTAQSPAAPYNAVNGNFRKFGATYLPVQCLHQRKVYKKTKL